MPYLPHQYHEIVAGGNSYSLRTLSLREVYFCQDSLRKLQAALQLPREAEGRGKAVFDELHRLAAELCPELAKERYCEVDGCPARGTGHADLLHLEPEQINQVLKFYGQQDWKRLVDLIAEAEDGSTVDGTEEGKRAAVVLFMQISALGAKQYNIPYDAFGELRFDEAAPMLQGVIRAAREVAGKRRGTMGSFVHTVEDQLVSGDVEGLPPFVEMPDPPDEN